MCGPSAPIPEIDLRIARVICYMRDHCDMDWATAQAMKADLKLLVENYFERCGGQKDFDTSEKAEFVTLFEANGEQ